jgi:small subunit ribosomal protein S21
MQLAAAETESLGFRTSKEGFFPVQLTVRRTTATILPSSTFEEKRFLMPEVIVRKGEPIDRALKRLKNKLDAEGIMEEVRRLRAFETPNQKVRRKAKLAAKRGKLKFRFNP